mmetsp:Transcript_7805/g.8952  ORF Transcript_7805/g.8952 Transcript_7805/m.8952 type:complete len:126 (+) Transcript_7805:170-547(+)
MCLTAEVISKLGDSTWIQDVNPQYKDTTNFLHKNLVNGAAISKDKLRASYGFTVSSKNKRILPNKDYYQTKVQSVAYFKKEWTQVNNKLLTPVERLQLIQDGEVGALLVLTRKPGKEFITAFSCP